MNVSCHLRKICLFLKENLIKDIFFSLFEKNLFQLASELTIFGSRSENRRPGAGPLPAWTSTRAAGQQVSSFNHVIFIQWRFLVAK